MTSVADVSAVSNINYVEVDGNTRKNKAVIDITLRPTAAFSSTLSNSVVVRRSWQTFSKCNIVLNSNPSAQWYENMTSSTKPEVLYLSQCHSRISCVWVCGSVHAVKEKRTRAIITKLGTHEVHGSR